jgi:hypothetical protein
MDPEFAPGGFRNSRTAALKKMAPLLGPLVKEASWRVGSGMAMQSAAPPAGTATREMSNTESEGHCLSAASFVALKPCTCATKASPLIGWLTDRLQIVEK